MKFLPLLTLLSLSVYAGSCRADIITTINFDDAIWDIQAIETASDLIGAQSGSQFSGNSLTAEKDTTDGGAVIVTATLTGTISTIGFENIQLEFTQQSSNLEYDASNFSDGSGDSFAITSSEGLNFSTLGASSAFETALDQFGDVWTEANASTFGQTLSFDATVNNGTISSLVVQLKVNGSSPAELTRIGNLTLTGSVATPEPRAICFWLLGTAGFVVFRRTRPLENDPRRTLASR